MERSCWPHLINPLCSVEVKVTAHSTSKHTHILNKPQIFLVSHELICQPQISLFPVFVSLLFTPVSLGAVKKSNAVVMLKDTGISFCLKTPK